MEQNNLGVCIEDIMKEIRQEIKDKHLNSEMLSFEDVPYKTPEQFDAEKNSDAEASFQYINSRYTLQPYKPLYGNPVSVFIKKIIRKLTKFYIEPIAAEQSEFNANVVKVMNSLRTENNALRTELKNSEELAEKISILELNQKNLSIRIEALEKENERLSKSAAEQEES